MSILFTSLGFIPENHHCISNDTSETPLKLVNTLSKEESDKIILSLRPDHTVYYSNRELPIRSVNHDTGEVILELDTGLFVNTHISECRLFPQSHQFVRFISDAVITLDSREASESVKQHIDEYVILDAEQRGAFLVPPSTSSTVIGYDPENAEFDVPNLNDPYTTKSLAYALLSGYKWTQQN
ncbi:hypothetical protein VCHA53O466_140173 [Vibrio chagasii]|nr:hypothetical protein VCHA53O466_140173 [Vibrio chagasii]